VLAESDDTVAHGGYAYFPSSSVRTDLLVPSPRTASDDACPHGVQFYDVVVDGVPHARAAWRYEKPRASMAHVADRFGFWRDVVVR
jgi:uncharacterized protein (DUF427 family)